MLFLAHEFCKIPFPIFEAGGVGCPDVGFAGEEVFFLFFFSCFGLGGLGMKERKKSVSQNKETRRVNRVRRGFGGLIFVDFDMLLLSTLTFKFPPSPLLFFFSFPSSWSRRIDTFCRVYSSPSNVSRRVMSDAVSPVT